MRMMKFSSPSQKAEVRASSFPQSPPLSGRLHADSSYFVTGVYYNGVDSLDSRLGNDALLAYVGISFMLLKYFPFCFLTPNFSPSWFACFVAVSCLVWSMALDCTEKMVLSFP